MKKSKLTILTYICLSIIACVTIAGCHPTERFDRTINLSEPLEPGKSFAVKTHNGHINVSGIETNSCEITAKISGWAKTIERAEELCQAVTVRLESDADGLKVIIDKPKTTGNEGSGVAFDVTLANQTNQTLATHNGAISIKNIIGNAKAETHNGKIGVNDLRGDSVLKTHNGQINCKQTGGNSELETHNGAISLAYTGTDQNPHSVKIITHNGRISFKAPKEYSATVTARTHNGLINTNLPVTIKGKLDKKNFNATIGTGEGTLYLETHNGGISIE